VPKRGRQARHGIGHSSRESVFHLQSAWYPRR
jgi:hypothetical protein